MIMMNWLKNASVGVKVAFAPALGMLCLAFMGAVGIYANVQLGDSLQSLAAERLPRVVRVSGLQQQLTGLNAAVNQSLAWEAVGFKEEKIQALDRRIGSDMAKYGALLEELAADDRLDAVEREVARRLLEDYAKFRKSSMDALDIKTGMVANAATFMATIEGSYGRLKDSFDRLVEHEKALASAAAGEGRSLGARNNALIVGGFLCAAVLSALFAWLSSRLIVRPLRRASQIALQMAAGDFTARPDAGSRDATGQLLDALAKVSVNVGVIVHDIRTTAEQLDHASGEIASGNEDLSRRTESAAASLQQTAASLEQMTATIRSSAANAAQADSMARQASEVAEEGGRAVDDAVGTMNLIDSQAKKIREITSVIDGIAFQTNILALNAAVEAARAGEQGRGFAVVAQEVRTLAQRSASAAKEIRALIGQSVGQIETGAQKVQTAGQTMQRIVDSIRKVSIVIAEISRAAGEQAGGIAQINSAVSDMDRSTQQNAALVEQAAAATDRMKDQARLLVQAIDTLRTA
jgi:methyl-accepting chemotaxis protein